MNPTALVSRQATRPRWVLFFLAALVTVWTILGMAGTASAATGSGAGNRVGASTQNLAPLVGPPKSVSPGQRLGEGRSGAEIVVATGVATNTAADGGPGEWGTAQESMSQRASEYQSRITGQPEGSVYRVNGVKFDGYEDGVLQEAKGPGYANFVKDGEFQPWYNGADQLAAQAQRQLAAAGGTPITWSVAEPDAVTAINNLFSSRGIYGINVVNVP
jgi:hypothetical protein